ncbi:hypothetical protein BCU70_00650 [Vibrio sp. 10N.286.49.C2]|uniref:hypothetical protein n=1 Tax=unclassified Vibrio TaxID=2614977 RepID=UPI000C8179F9|nr:MULTISPECIES: hypothetical protein [unclassified Vibrio]PMH43404.1 hypothetical protein BCU70_00650 [Vibrio sp. 10N.286.49.C2]PMH57056.1 hypothetical protein BCU66_06040 [Vibrio sp. 10N.286.49.B1]PMH78536.1 hypothetical protein BCU58_08885 [Vibrio sp. 10N.286.48.B7]
MLLREFKAHFARGDIDGAIAIKSEHNDHYYLLVVSNKWGVNSFLETGKTLKPRIFKTIHALMNTVEHIGLSPRHVEVQHGL